MRQKKTTLQSELTNKGTPRQRNHRERTREEKEEIVLQVAAHQDTGATLTEISQALDVPRTTLRQWCTPELMEEVRQGTSGIAVRRLKADMVESFAPAVQIGLDTVARLLGKAGTATLSSKDAADYARAARESAVAMGIVADKLLIATGQATARTEHVDKTKETSGQAVLDALQSIGITLPNQPKQGEIIEAEYTVHE